MLDFELRVPAAMVTVADTAATDGLELDNETATPPVGTAAFNVTFAEMAFPPTTLACPSVTEKGARLPSICMIGTQINACLSSRPPESHRIFPSPS